jgi:uncharacterized protein YggU (UPF0235/DUF167 family)
VSAPASADLRVRVVPRAARAGLAWDAARQMLRVHVTAPPVDDAANHAVLALLAARLGLAPRALEIIRGARGRDKTVRVHGLTPAALEARVSAALASVDKRGSRG